jgi:hypothetical protein
MSERLAAGLIALTGTWRAGAAALTAATLTALAALSALLISLATLTALTGSLRLPILFVLVPNLFHDLYSCAALRCTRKRWLLVSVALNLRCTSKVTAPENSRQIFACYQF